MPVEKRHRKLRNVTCGVPDKAPAAAEICLACGLRYDDHPHREMTAPDLSVSVRYSEEEVKALNDGWPQNCGDIGEPTAASVQFPHSPGAKFCPWWHNILREWPKQAMFLWLKRLYQCLAKARSRAARAAAHGDAEEADDEA